MGETRTGKDKGQARAPAAEPSFADASARFIADQTAVMTMMTAVGVNIATQVAGAFMGAIANALEKPQAAAPLQAEPQGKTEEAPKVVPLRVVRKAAPPKTDDLKRISGIGPRLEKVLHGMGVRTFADMAKWNDDDAVRIDCELGLDNRIIRDGWVKQAKALLEG